MTMDINSLKTHKFKIFLCSLAILIIAVLIFLAGIFVGFQKARFSYGLGQRYYNDFFQGRPPLFDQSFVNSHGASGSITNISGKELTIKDNNVSKIILITDSTIIRRNRIDASAADLKIGDEISVIGGPNDQGQIVAKFIRVK
jgi:hypothetical protein